MSKSLADQAVATLAALQAMDTDNTDKPERHAVRALKREAEEMLSQAFRRAQMLAYLAGDLSALVANVEQHAAQAQTAQPGEQAP